MRRLRLTGCHALGLWRCWNRPLGRWRTDFWLQFALLSGMCLLGGWWAAWGIFCFSVAVITWTCVTVRDYRRDLRDGNGETGDRFRVHDRDDIWKGRWPF